MLLKSWRGILIGIVSESCVPTVKSLYRPLFWRIWRLLGIRPLTNLLFKRYTVILIDTPTLPSPPQNKQDPSPSPNKIQTNKRKQNTRHIFKINMRDANLLLFISVHVCVGRGGGVIKHTHYKNWYLLKLWFLRKQQRKTSNYEVINLWIHWIITNINYIIGGNDLPSYIWQVCPHLSESCFLLVHLMYWEAERGATKQTAPLF